MTRKEAERQTHQADTLRALGFTRDEAEALRRISMTLQSWFEKECGDSNAYGSFAIERDENGDGKPFWVYHPNDSNRVTRTPIADRETGARKRLAAILAARNHRVRVEQEHAVGDVLGSTATDVRAYVQTDPRGAALYILRPGDVPTDADESSYYPRGVCVW